MAGERMKEFSFSDLGRVYWPATAKVAVARGFASGLIFVFLNIITQPGAAIDPLAFVILPFGMAMVAMPMGLFFNVLGKITDAFIPLLGLFFTAFGALVVCLGDPLVYLLNRRFPALFDVADFRFFNFTPLLFITHPE